MASLFPAKGEGEGDRGDDDAGSEEEDRAFGAVGAASRLGESPGPGSDSESRSSSPSPCLTEQFERAAERVPALVAAASREQLLYLYARYKQVKCGSCNTPKPGFFDFEGKQKWEAWKALSDASPEQAMREYVATVKKLDPTWNPQGSSFFQSGSVVQRCRSLGVFFSSTIWLKRSISHSQGFQCCNLHSTIATSSGPVALPIFICFIGTATSSDVKRCTGPKTG